MITRSRLQRIKWFLSVMACREKMRFRLRHPLASYS